MNFGCSKCTNDQRILFTNCGVSSVLIEATSATTCATSKIRKVGIQKNHLYGILILQGAIQRNMWGQNNYPNLIMSNSISVAISCKHTVTMSTVFRKSNLKELVWRKAVTTFHHSYRQSLRVNSVRRRRQRSFLKTLKRYAFTARCRKMIRTDAKHAGIIAHLPKVRSLPPQHGKCRRLRSVLTTFASIRGALRIPGGKIPNLNYETRTERIETSLHV